MSQCRSKASSLEAPGDPRVSGQCGEFGMQAARPGLCGRSGTKMQPLDSRVCLSHYLINLFGERLPPPWWGHDD